MARYSQSMFRRSFKSKLLITVLMICLIYSIVMISSTHIQADIKEIVSANIPRSFHDLTILYASDFLYNGGSTFYIDNVISKINSYRADIVILGGNYGNNYDNSLKFFEIIPNIHSNMGVYAVLGKNDISANRDDYYIENRMQAKNISLLVNKGVNIKKDGDNICVFGIDDIEVGNPNFSYFNCGEDFTIFACNSAKGIDNILEIINNSGRDYVSDIALFGSTLGGQYILNDKLQKLINPLGSPKFFNGWHGNNKNNILVSNGIGAQDFGFRIAVPPQVHYIKVKYR